MDIEEDFAALRDSFTSLRASIQKELMSRADPSGGFSSNPAPVQRPGLGPGMARGTASPIHPVGEEAVHHSQFSALREQLMDGWAASSACGDTPHVPSRIAPATKPTQPLPPGMSYEVRASPAKAGGAHEGRCTAPPPAPNSVSVERTSADTVVLNAPKPGRSGGASLLAATETAHFSGPARAQAAEPYKQEDSAADVAKQYRVRAEVLRSATNTVASGQSLSGGDSVVFGHLAMRAALESHRRHYAESRAALRPDGSKLQPTAQMQQPTSGPRSARKATEPRGPSLATADRSRMVRSAFGSTVTPFIAGGGSNSPSALPPGCEASIVAAVLPQEELSRLHDRIGAQRASMPPRAASAGSCSAPRAPLSARPSSAKGKQRTVPLIAATAR